MAHSKSHLSAQPEQVIEGRGDKATCIFYVFSAATQISWTNSDRQGPKVQLLFGYYVFYCLFLAMLRDQFLFVWL